MFKDHSNNMYTTQSRSFSYLYYGDNPLENFRVRVREFLESHKTLLGERIENSYRLADRMGMIETIFEIPFVKDLTISPFYRGKDQTLAKELYEKSLRDEEKSFANLTEALFTASPDEQLYLDILWERAKICFNLEAFANCIKDCDCVLSQCQSSPERRKACLALKRQCSKALKKKVDKSLGKLPDIDGSRNLKIQNCSDAMALDHNEEKGRHFVATRDIEPGTVLIVDRAFSFAMEEEALPKNCLHCHVTLGSTTSHKMPCNFCRTVTFCSERCRDEAWQQYHRYECLIFDYFLKGTCYHQLAYRTTVRALETVKNDDFVRYHSKGPDEEKTYDPLDYRTVLQLETHSSNSEFYLTLDRAIDAIFFAKCLICCLKKIDEKNDSRGEEWQVILACSMLHHLQAISCNAYEIVENVKDEERHVWEPRRIGGAIYTTVSLTNHSCYPNVVRHTYKSGWVVVRAIRSIKKGHEILDCYGPHFLVENFSQRRNCLQFQYHFKCKCDACKYHWKLPLPEINYACTECTNSDLGRHSKKSETSHMNCSQCGEKIDERVEERLKQSIKKRAKAMEKVYAGYYKDALPSLIEHEKFVSKFLTDPNKESVVTQQCIIQCFNSCSCVSE